MEDLQVDGRREGDGVPAPKNTGRASLKFGFYGFHLWLNMIRNQRDQDCAPSTIRWFALPTKELRENRAQPSSMIFMKMADHHIIKAHDAHVP